MPRDIPLANGRLLVTFDAQYHIRDLYFPRIGGENHTAGHPFRFGVWTEGRFSWVHDDTWTRALDYEDDTLVSCVRLTSTSLGIALDCRDAVDFHETIYVRHVRIHNLADHPREVRLFFHHDFHISDFEIGDTAYYHPRLGVVIHYKGPRYFLINIRTADGRGIGDYATGIKESEGKEGTWRDAEGDGVLSKNPIAQGSVDSTVAVSALVQPGRPTDLFYWICVGESYQEVTLLNQLILDKGPQTLLDRTAAYWSLWVNKSSFDFDGLPAEVVRQFKRSLLIIRTQIDAGGAIIAANDTDNQQFNRDTYSYMWPRDGALVAHSLDLAEMIVPASAFYRFCQPLITREGYFLHKYNPDGSTGSSWHPWIQDGEPVIPIQEDETALVIWALWKHFDRYGDVENIKPLYRSVIIRAGDFMAGYVDHATGLPLPSYDLWEERWGVHAWTAGAVYGGLMAAANFAAAFGEAGHARKYREAAQRIRRAVETLLWRPEAGRFVRTLQKHPSGTFEADYTLDASVLGLVFFGMIPASDARVEQTVAQLRARLTVPTPVGGLARYENDPYHRIDAGDGQIPGNPWFLCTLWVAQYQIARAASLDDLGEPLQVLEWAARRALASGVLAEQLHPYTGAPLSVAPLTWSHSAYVTTVLEWLDRKADLAACPTCGRPLFTKEHARMVGHRAHKSIGG
ncbi:MAG: glycoside hydrolase family 15 protein [Chthonomonadales bacterium]